MAVTKQDFMSRGKVRNLPPAERERRWKQHLMSEGGLRDQRTISGRGNYFTRALRAVDNKVLKRIPRGAFAKAGGFLGGDIGRQAGGLISQITGRGDYNIKSNSIMSGDDLKPTNLSFSPTGAAGIRIKKREFISTVRVPADASSFAQTLYRLQCTDGTSFPWLSQIASHFTEWQLMGAVVSFETTSSNYSASMALGTIAIGTQYNSNELPFRDMEDILQSAYHTRGNPSETLMHGIECDPKLQVSDKLFTRRACCSGPPNLYDHGVVTIAHEGLPTDSANQVIGRLYITYDIELNLPVLPFRSLLSGQAAGWYCPVSSSDPPFGAAQVNVAIDDPCHTIKCGSDASSQCLFLTPDDKPHVRPHFASELRVFAWLSADLNTLGTSAPSNFLSFSEPGTYVLEMVTTYPSSTSVQGNGFFNCQPYTSNVEVIKSVMNPMSMPSNVWLTRYIITATSTDQTVLMIRTQNYTTQDMIQITSCGSSY